MSRYFKLVAAVLLLAALYWYCDWRRVGTALAGLDTSYLALAFLLFVPQTIVSSLRWRMMTAPLCRISLGEAVRQTLSASAWNLIAPSKLGDLTKAAMLPLPPADRRKAWALVFVEKGADVAALSLVWCVAYLAANAWMWLLPTVALAAMIARCGIFGRDRDKDSVLDGLCSPGTVCSSLFLWLLHLAQIHLMLLAAGVPVRATLTLTRVPAAIFAGLMPVSFCGIGTRDGALIWLFSDVAAAGTMAAVGLLTATRYIVPGLAGIVVQTLRRVDGPAPSPSNWHDAIRSTP